MEALRAYWRSLSIAWKAFNIAFFILLPVGVWLLQDPLWGTIFAIVWAAAVAGFVRLFTRTGRPPRW